jgi:hypothetical protein
MNPRGANPPTRVWWDEGEVEFIRWTEKSLVFAWCNATETAIHMPRGAVVRLLEKGVLRIEGNAPDWIQRPQQRELQPVSPLQPTQCAEPESAAKPDPEPPSRFNVIARLIRKLGGGEQDPARVTG